MSTGGCLKLASGCLKMVFKALLKRFKLFVLDEWSVICNTCGCRSKKKNCSISLLKGSISLNKLLTH